MFPENKSPNSPIQFVYCCQWRQVINYLKFWLNIWFQAFHNDGWRFRVKLLLQLDRWRRRWFRSSAKKVGFAKKSKTLKFSYFCLHRSSLQDVKLWDTFQDPPSEESSASSVDIEWIRTLTQLAKIVAYWIVFVVVAVSSVLSKISLLFMTSHVADNPRIPFCDIASESTNKKTCQSDNHCLSFFISARETAWSGDSRRTSHRLEVSACVCVRHTGVWCFYPSRPALVLQKHSEPNLDGVRDGVCRRNDACFWTRASCLQNLARTWRHPRGDAYQLLVLRSIDFV